MALEKRQKLVFYFLSVLSDDNDVKGLFHNKLILLGLALGLQFQSQQNLKNLPRQYVKGINM